MRFNHALAALAFSSMAIVACGAPDGSTGSTEPGVESSSQALKATGGMCTSDWQCVAGDVCDVICPVSPLPGHFHCEIAGSHCEPRATQTVPGLGGHTFTSVDGAHTITFTYSTDPDTVHDAATTATFVKRDACSPQPSGIHCNSIQIMTGTYSLDKTGTVVTLTADLGGGDSLKVSPHYYDGLFDDGKSVQLYPN
jgi:hypothetical protein